MPEVNANVEFSLPSPVTLAIWQVYSQGRSQYVSDLADKALQPDNLISKYHGAIALIKANLVHVIGDHAAVLRQEIDKGDNAPMSVVAFVINKVALPMEQSFNDPLPWATTEQTS